MVSTDPDIFDIYKLVLNLQFQKCNEFNSKKLNGESIIC